MKTIVIGGGIGGLCTALALQQIGIAATVYEAAPRFMGLGAGVGLAANAMQALARLGVAEDVKQHARQLDAFVISDEEGKVIVNMDARELNSKYDTANYMIHRPELHEVLRAHLQPDTIKLGKRCESIEQQEGRVQVTFADGSHDTADLLIAADGISSVVRQLLLPKSMPRYAGYTCWRAVINNPGIDVKEALSETWAAQGRVGIAPLTDNRIYWYACMNAPSRSEHMKEMTPEKLAHQFESLPYPAEHVMAYTTPDQLLWNDVVDLEQVKHLVYGHIVLLGDAGHALTPNMGQGACQAIEDAVVLGQCLQQEPDLDEALKKYEKRRMPRVAKVAEMSRMLGEMAHWQNPLLGRLRNSFIRIAPKFITNQQMEDIYKVDF